MAISLYYKPSRQMKTVIGKFSNEIMLGNDSPEISQMSSVWTSIVSSFHNGTNIRSSTGRAKHQYTLDNVSNCQKASSQHICERKNQIQQMATVKVVCNSVSSINSQCDIRKFTYSRLAAMRSKQIVISAVCRKILRKAAIKTNYDTQFARHFHVTYTTCNLGSLSPIRKDPPWRVLFFGTDQIAVHTLKELHNNM